MKGIVLYIFLYSFVTSIVCENGFEYVKIRKQGQYNANQEKFKILSGNVVVYENPEMVDFQLREIETCITSSTNAQYTLELSDSDNTSWTSGSWIEIQGIYGNIAFKSYLVDNSLELYNLSLYYPIKENSVVKFKSGFVSEDWTSLSFSDSSWIEVDLTSPSAISSGTQYYRRLFNGVDGLAAYELRMKYQFGIVAYIHGVEVYRDNLPEGEITASTYATGSYSSLEYHSLIRNGIDINGASVVAVELHWIQDSPQTSISFNMWMAQYASSYVATHSLNCYSIPYTPTVTVSTGNNGNYASDFNKSSYWSITDFEAPASIMYQYSNMQFNMNGISIFPSVNPSYSPSAFTLQGKKGSTFVNLFSVDELVYTAMEYQMETSPFASDNYNQMKLIVEEIPDEKLWLYELNPLVCSLSVPDSMTLSPASTTAMVNIETIEIQPTQRGFTNCVIAPSLPLGLMLDSETCRISGRATQTLSSTVFTITAMMNTTYTGTFTLTIEDCEGGIIEFTRTYKNNAQREGFLIKDKNTNEVVFSEEVETTQVSSVDVVRRLCLPGTEYVVVLSCTEDYWASNSFLYIDAISNTMTERLLRTRFDNRIGLPTAVDFSLHYVIPAASSWYYYSSSVPSNWYDANVDLWTLYPMGSYPSSSNRIQLYKKTFSITSIETIAAMAFNLHYHYGCVVYVNQHEVFRLGFSDALSETSTTTHVYETVMYRSITLPTRIGIDNESVNVLIEGLNTIAIGLLAVSDTQVISEFDCALRLISQSESNRIFDYSISSSGVSGTAANVFLDYYSNSIYYRTCTDNFVELTFDNDRREAVTSFSVNTYYSNMNYLPGGVTLKAKNPEDSEYTLLGVFSGWKWWQNPQLKKMYLTNSKAFNIYRFENFNTGNSADCYWKLNRLALYVDSIAVNVSSLSYPSMDAYRGIELAEIFPSISTFLSFSIQPDLPSGLFMDPYTGVILGKPDTITESPLFTVTALRLDGGNVSATFHLNVTECRDGKSLITMNIRTDTAPTQISTRLFGGRGTEGNPIFEETSFPSNTMVYQDFCLSHGIYTFEALDSNGNGWYFPAGFHMTVDRGTLPFFITHIPEGEAPVSVTHTFSSYLPFQVDFDDWKVWKEATIPSDWKTPSFDDSEWTVSKAAEIGTAESVTVYIRKSFPIPSLSDYHVLNVHVKYTGGLAVYFNTRLVARFNLDASFNKDTEAPQKHDASKYSSFHIILATSGASIDSNTLAFEVHRATGESSAVPIVFDATGIFGVEDCSYVIDTYSSITGTNPTTNDLEDAFDTNPSSFMNLPKTEGNTVEWIVENLEGSRFNSYGLLVGLTMQDMGWTLSGRFDSSQDYSQMDKRTGLSVVNRELNSIRTPVAYAGFKQYRWIMDTSSSTVPRISEFVFQYCKPQGEGVCPGVGDYPSVSEGEISPSVCPEMYEGYSYRLCQEGVLGEIKMEHCVPKLPSNLAYPQELYVFVLGTQVSTGAPSYDNIVDSFNLDEGTVLPEGLVLEETTGMIRGTPSVESDVVTYTVYAKNQRGAVLTTVTISIRKGICKAENHFDATPVGEVFVYECSKEGSYVGTQTRRCVLGETDGVWEKPLGMCTSVVVIVVVVIVVLVILLVVVYLVIRLIKKRKRGVKVKGGVNSV